MHKGDGYDDGQKTCFPTQESNAVTLVPPPFTNRPSMMYIIKSRQKEENFSKKVENLCLPFEKFVSRIIFTYE